MKAQLNSKPANKMFFLPSGFFVLTLLLIGCSATGPSDAIKFLDAINNSDKQTANQYVCKDKQNTFIDDLAKAASIGAKGEDVLGLQSPGIKDISCQEKDSAIVCSFTAPLLICSGLSLDDSLQNKPMIKCTSFDPNGVKKTISLEVTNGRFCGFTVGESK